METEKPIERAGRRTSSGFDESSFGAVAHRSIFCSYPRSRISTDLIIATRVIEQDLVLVFFLHLSRPPPGCPHDPPSEPLGIHQSLLPPPALHDPPRPSLYLYQHPLWLSPPVRPSALFPRFRDHLGGCAGQGGFQLGGKGT